VSTNSNSELQPSGLGGWLILVGIGLFVGPIRLLSYMSQTYPPIFRDGTWENLTTPDNDFYHPLWAPILISEMIGNALIIAVGVYLIILFFRRSPRFPRLYVALLAASLIFIVVNAWLFTFVLPTEPMFDSDTALEFWRAFLFSSVWGPYMLLSKRVKNTFV
jgi:hypothetical protein